MAKMIVEHKVEDFGKWKSVFDSLAPVHRQFGLTDAQVYQGNGKPNDVVVVTHWGSNDQAKKWSQSPELKDAMQKAGVAGPPNIYFVD